MIYNRLSKFINQPWTNLSTYKESITGIFHATFNTQACIIQVIRLEGSTIS